MIELTTYEKREIALKILNGETDEALELASSKLHIAPPRLRIGLPKGEGRVYACYQARNKTIYFANGEVKRNPFVAMHEFYHHLRIHQGRHRGTEKLADAFALSFLLALKSS